MGEPAKTTTSTPRGYYDAQDVIDAARGRWANVLGAFGVRVELLTGRHGPCPGCGGRDRFRYDDQNGDGTFICSQGGAGNLAGNGVTLLQHCTGWEWKKCIEELGRKLLPDAARKTWAEGAVRAPVEDLPAEPKAELPNIPAYDQAKLVAYTENIRKVTREDLKRISPVPVHQATAADFLEALYATDERILVFTEFYSQGDFLYQVGKGSCRLSQERGTMAVVSPLPTTAREGIWYLCNPVNGRWAPGESKRKLVHVPRGHEGPPQLIQEHAKWSRRSWRTVTTYRYAVLESDCAPEDLWLKALIKLPLPIVAIYSSGGKSLHALVRIDAGDKATWDVCVRGNTTGLKARQAALMDLVCPLGADPAALTSVRLTRLPFCTRQGVKTKDGYKRYESPRMQELVYLAPMPLDQPAEWRSIETRHQGGRS